MKRFICSLLILLMCLLVSGAEETKLSPLDNFSAYYELMDDGVVSFVVPFISNVKITELSLKACHDFSGKSLSAEIGSNKMLSTHEKDGFYYNRFELSLKTGKEDISGLRLTLYINGGEKTAELELGRFGLKYTENSAKGDDKYVLAMNDVPMMLENKTEGFSLRNFVMEARKNFTLKSFRFSNALKLEGVRLNSEKFDDAGNINRSFKKGETLDFSFKYKDAGFESPYTFFNVVMDYQLEGEDELRSCAFYPTSFLSFNEEELVKEFDLQLEKIKNEH